jgi:mycofactocin precursor
MDNERDDLDHAGDAAHGDASEQTDELVDELLIEEISIDGMCGVY